MIYPAIVALTADRFVPWNFVIRFTDIDLTLAAMTMQVRQLPDATGTPLLSLENGSEITLALVGADTTATISVAEAVMEALPAAPEVGQDLTLYYDIHITPYGGTKGVYFKGTFTVIAGVTQ